MHAAGWNTAAEEGNIRDAKQLEEILKDYTVHVFCGHTHFFQNAEPNAKLYQHNIGAVCGAWWDSWINRCGAPNGYLIVNVDGNDVSWSYKATREKAIISSRLIFQVRSSRRKIISLPTSGTTTVNARWSGWQMESQWGDGKIYGSGPELS